MNKSLGRKFMASLLATSMLAAVPFSFQCNAAEQTSDTYAERSILPVKQTVITPETLTDLPKSVNLVDAHATEKTVKLYAYLKGIAKSNYVIYGHQDDTTQKTVLRDSGTNSDTKDVTGSIAGVFGIDGLAMTGAELELKAPYKDTVTQTAAVSISAAKEGAVVTLSAHMPNFAGVKKKGKKNGKYDYTGYTPNDTSGNVVNRILPGGDLNDVYTGYLDMVAQYAGDLAAADVPVLFRPFHENNGSWFWWGAGHCDGAAFKDAYRYTVNYLRDVKAVHNFIYVYSPNGPFETEESYLATYPGDNYVDVLAFDYYDTENDKTGKWFSSFSKTADVVSGLAEKHSKLSAVAETGLMSNGSFMSVSNNADKDWFNRVLKTIEGKNIAYFMTWANFNEKDGFFQPYMVSSTKGHEMIDNFTDFYNAENSVFADGIGDYAGIIANNTNTGGNISGYIKEPVSGGRIISAPSHITASVNAPFGTDVDFIIKNNDGTTIADLKGQEQNGDFSSEITQEILDKAGKTYGSISLSIAGTTYDKINIIFNIPETADKADVVDDFESYGGSGDLLKLKWSCNSGSGCSVSPALSTKYRSGGQYGLAFAYKINTEKIPEGYAGITVDKAVDWSQYDAVQLYCKPDGKGQKLVIQITSGGEDFEVHLPEFAATTEAKVLTLPFSKFVGKNKGKFDPSKVTKFGIWCNTIGSDVSVDSVMYFDDIKAVNMSSPSSGENEKTYVVKKGDTLWKIAKEKLGSGSKYMLIYNLNKNSMKNPDTIYAGETLILP